MILINGGTNLARDRVILSWLLAAGVFIIRGARPLGSEGACSRESDVWAQVLALTLSCVTSAKFWDLSGPRSPRSEHECDLASTLQPGMSYYLHSVQKEACAKKGFRNVYIQMSIATKCQLRKWRWLH